MVVAFSVSATAQPSVVSKVTFLRTPHFSNADFPIDSRFAGRVKVLSLVHPENASLPIEVTESGRVTLLMFAQSLNARDATEVTAFPLKVAGITISASVQLPIPFTL